MFSDCFKLGVPLKREKIELNLALKDIECNSFISLEKWRDYIIYRKYAFATTLILLRQYYTQTVPTN